jgi:hypothetical protein
MDRRDFLKILGVTAVSSTVISVPFSWPTESKVVLPQQVGKVSGLKGLVPGRPLYLSSCKGFYPLEGESLYKNELSHEVPDMPGESVYKVGIALSETEFLFQPEFLVTL